MFINFILAIPGRARNDGVIFVTLNLFQGRSGGKIGFNPAIPRHAQIYQETNVGWAYLPNNIKTWQL